jgi:chemotaxis protein MotB
MFKAMFRFAAVVILSLGLAGCTFIFQSGRRSDKLKIDELNAQLSELSKSRSTLEDQLSQEISDKQIKLQMMEKGLVITVVGDLLFDSGKAKIRSEAEPLLNKVAGILKTNMSQFNIGIEGYTDDQPIRHSGWKSNWELSTARALAVLHYLVNQEGLSPDRLSAIGYGEYRPVASNDSREGRQQNRRVEIVIQPKISKVKESASSEPATPSGNLK